MQSYSSSQHRRGGVAVILQDVVSETLKKLEGGGNPTGGGAAASGDNEQEATVIRSTQEALRLLETKVPVGRLGLKGDRQEVRVAILLDHVLRKQQQQQQQQQNQAAVPLLNLKDIARKMSVSYAQFLPLYNAIGNYYHDFQQAQTKQQQQQRIQQQQQNSISFSNSVPLPNSRKRGPLTGDSSQLATTVGTQRPKRILTTVDGVESLFRNEKMILQDLVIRLAMYLRDTAVSILRKTTDALKDLVRCSTSSASSKVSAAETRGQLYDFSRYWPAYQAAMLYHIVSISAGHDTTSIGNTTKNNSASLDNDDEGNMNLKLEDLVRASSAFTYLELREKVSFIQQWAKETKEKKHLKSSKHVVKGTETNQHKMSISTNSYYSSKGRADNKTHESVIAAGSDSFCVLDDDHDDAEFNAGKDCVTVEREEIATKAKEFAQWKENVLEAACAKFVKEGHGDPLRAAADQVLQKYGLLADAKKKHDIE